MHTNKAFQNQREAPIDVIRALNHVEFVVASFAHVDLGSFSLIPHILSSSVSELNSPLAFKRDLSLI